MIETRHGRAARATVDRAKGNDVAQRESLFSVFIQWKTAKKNAPQDKILRSVYWLPGEGSNLRPDD